MAELYLPQSARVKPRYEVGMVVEDQTSQLRWILYFPEFSGARASLTTPKNLPPEALVYGLRQLANKIEMAQQGLEKLTPRD